MSLTFRDIKILRGQQVVSRRRTITSKKTDNKKFAEKIICICGRRFSYVGGLTYHKKVGKTLLRHKNFFQRNCTQLFGIFLFLPFPHTQKKWECGKQLHCENCGKHFNVRSYFLNHCRTCL